jgi:hypothetical protein
MLVYVEVKNVLDTDEDVSVSAGSVRTELEGNELRKAGP